MKFFPLLNHFTFVMLCAVLVLTAASCKKNKAFKQETAQTAVDLRHAMGEMDEVIKDVNTVLMEQYLLRGRVSSASTPSTSVCGVTLDTLGLLTGKVTLTYNGTDCFGRTRTGKVIFTVEDYPLRKWKQKDCRVKIEYQQYQCQRSGGLTVKLEGTQTIINESGGSWFELWYGGQGQVVYRHTGNDVKVTFSGDKTCYFSVDRRLTYTFANNITSCTVHGLSNQKGRPNVEAWGISSESDNFAAEVTDPYLWRTSCGPVAPLRGAVTVVIDEKDFDLKCRYGVDSGGNAVSENSGTCPFGWETTWSMKKKTNSRLFGYY